MKKQSKNLFKGKSILLKSILSAFLLVSISNADDTVKKNIDINLGYLNFQQDNANEHDGGLLGFDVSFQKEVLINDLYLGGGVATEWFVTSDIEDKNSEYEWGILGDMYATIGYDITSNLSITGIGGYTFGMYGNNTLDGILYGVGVDYKLTDSFGLGLKYKANKFDDIVGTNVDSDRYLLSLSFKY